MTLQNAFTIVFFGLLFSAQTMHTSEPEIDCTATVEQGYTKFVAFGVAAGISIGAFAGALCAMSCEWLSRRIDRENHTQYPYLLCFKFGAKLGAACTASIGAIVYSNDYMACICSQSKDC